MIRLLYVSRAADDVDYAAIRGILVRAEANNARDGITGVLCYGRPFFAQCLEGARAAVNRTFGRIVRDPRHTAVEVVGVHPIEERLFTDWSMTVAKLEDISSDRVRKAVLRYGPSDRFNPDQMNSAQLLGFLEEIMRPPGAVNLAPVGGVRVA